VKGNVADARTVGAPPVPRPNIREQIRRLDVVLVVTIVIGAALRFWGVGDQSLWYDEWLTTEAVSGGLRNVFDHVGTREGIPPPYFLFMWGWVRLFGDGEIALRSVSVLAGIATIPIAYAIARELRQRRSVARVAALLIAINPMLVWYSQEARPYSVLAFFGALSVLAFARAWNRGRSHDYVVWGLVCAGAVAVHYYAIFLVAAELGALFLRRRQQWRRLLLASVPTVAILAVLAPVALDQRSHSLNYEWISNWALGFRLSEAGRTALVGPASPREGLWMVVAGIGVLAAGLVITRGSRSERSAAALLVAVAGAAVVMPLATGLIGFDIFLSRYLMGALVPLLVAASIGFAARRAVWLGAAALAVLCAISLTLVVAVARDPDLQRPEWRSVADVSNEEGGDRALVMNLYGYLGNPLLYYADGARPLGETETASVDEVDVVVAKGTTKPCNFLVGSSCGFIFLGAPLPEPLASQFALVERHELEQFTVNRYRASQPVPVTIAELVAPGNPADALVLVSR
jgi:mannosyltransferase